MRCLTPIWMYDTGRLTASGKRLLKAVCGSFDGAIPVPCGKCEACLARRRSEWVARLRFENLSAAESSFVTLTYEDNPKTLIKRDVQLFLKRLRNIPRDFGLPETKVRYFVVGEYGKKFHRPHWHGLIYGMDFLKPVFKPRMALFKDGHPIYTSDVLSSVWSHGFVSVDSVTPHSIRYVAKYVTKDNSLSLKSQGLGRSLFVRVSRHGRLVDYALTSLYRDFAMSGFLRMPDKVGGFSAVGIPKAFDRYLERCDSSLFDSVRAMRRDFVNNLPFDSRSVADCLRCLDSINKQKERLLDECS